MNAARRPAELAAVLPRPLSGTVVSGRSRLQHARTVVEAFAMIGLAAAALNVGGQVVAANKLFGTLVPGTVRELRGRPRLTDPAADRLIVDAVTRICSGAAGGAPRSVAIRAQGGQPPTMINLIPIPVEARDVLSGVGAILVVTTALPRPTLSPDILKGLFDLSPAEARVAHGIAAGWTIEAIAARSGVSRETVRCQLKTVLAKTGTKRQLELAVLLHGMRHAKL